MTGWDFVVQLRDDDIDEVEAFMDELQGMANPFWMPGPLWSHKITANVSSSSFKIREQGASSSWNAGPGKYLYFTKDGYDGQTGLIKSITSNGDGTETVVLEQPLDESVDSTWAVQPLYLVRLASNEEQIEQIAERYQRRTFRVVELPHDYGRVHGNRVTLPAEPVFLYRFTLALPDGDVVWRYTSHPSDVSVSGYTWTSARIEHGTVRKSMRDGGTMPLVGDYDTVEPLKLSVPLRYAVPLKVELLECTTALLSSTVTTLFVGWATKPSLEGRRVSVSCVEWGDVLSARIPAMHIDRECNYDLYDSNTCRVVQASFTVAVTISAVSGRSVTVTGAGLAGKAANWFAFGWIETGSGLNRQVRAILASTAASGTSVTLTVNETLDVEVPVSGSVIAGCDRKRSTCVSKFDNLVNYGGHAPPRTNLTLAAVEAEEGGGKK